MKLVSLFSGCGGMDSGFQKAGFEIVFANDIDEHAQKVYELNLGEIDYRDIQKISASEIPDCDILTAGFPCQPFSSAGKRLGVEDDRGELYKQTYKIINHKKPKVVVFENVRGILSTKASDGKHLIEKIKEDLEGFDEGYNVVYKLVKASDFEVPQNRYRVILVGVRKDLGKHFVFPHKIQCDNLTVSSVINVPEDVPNQVTWELSPQAGGLVKYIPEGGSWKDIPYEHLPERLKKIKDNMKKYRSPNFYRRFGRGEINGTITASAQPENCGILHPLENRRYSIREIARIQSFSDDFKFIDSSRGDIIGMYKVIGNAVPPKLAYHIASAIKAQIFLED